MFRLRRRAIFVTLALATIAIGLLVNRGGRDLFGADIQDKLGDALWAAMIVWWVGAAVPLARLWSRAIAAYALCVAVEFSQLAHTPPLDAIRATRAGHLVLGMGFDLRDLLAYASGVGAAALLEVAFRRRASAGEGLS